jgi:periplasmic protein CpxP/Spy
MKTFRIAFLAVMVGFTSLAFAQSGSMGQGEQQKPGGGHHGMGHHQMPSVDDQVNELSKKLNLSDDQKTQVRSILQDQHDKMTQLFQDNSTAPEDRRAKMREIHQNSNQKIRDLLNDDQKKQFEEYLQQQQQRRQSRMHEGTN